MCSNIIALTLKIGVLVWGLQFINYAPAHCEKTKGQASSTLQLVQIVHNSGLSSPKFTFPNDPNKEALDRLGFGQLTNVGKRAEYGLGQYLRRTYGEKGQALIDELYVREQVLVRSADDDPALSSALTLLAGLFAPKSFQIWDKKLKWQPIPVHTVPLDTDILLAPNEAFDFYDELCSTKYRKKFNKKNKAFYANLTVLSGMDVSDAGHVSVIEEALKFAELNNLSAPLWAQEPQMRNNIRDIANTDFKMKIDTSELQFFTSGVLLNEIIIGINNKTNYGNLEKKRIDIFTTNDLVIASLLSLLNVYNDKRPTSGSAIIFELHVNSTSNEQTVKILYKNETLMRFTNLPLTFCSEPEACSVQQLTEWVAKTTTQIFPGKTLNLMAFNNRANPESVTVTVTITTTSIIIIGGFIMLTVAIVVCCYTCTRNKRRGYTRVK